MSVDSTMCQMHGRVVSVSVSDERGIQKTPVDTAELVADWGIRDDAHAGPGIRQISLLAKESADKVREVGIDVGDGDFAENVLTENLDLRALPIGTRLTIGDTEVEVTKIGKECHSPCHIGRTMGWCVMPVEGIFSKVIKGGTVRSGDNIEVAYPDEIGPDETVRVKREMRRLALERRRALDDQHSGAAARAIWARIEAMEVYAEAKRIVFYVSSKDNEVDTTKAMDRAIDRGIEVIVPIVEPGARTMVWSRLESRNQLVPGTFGILEPRPEERNLVDPGTADVIIVPLIAFDSHRRRIGYGGGFYDRFLSTFDGPTISPAFSVQQMPRIYTGPHDITINHIVTETGD